MPRGAIESVETFAARDPKGSGSILARRLDVIGRQASRIRRIVKNPPAFPSLRIQPVETLARRQPEKAVRVLIDVDHDRIAGFQACIQGIVFECLGDPLEPIQTLVAADPNGPGTILEERINEDAAEAAGSIGRVYEDLEPIGVEPIQPVLRSEPNEPLIVLNDLRDARLRQPLGERQTAEPNIISRNDRYRHGLR
jgi:hypothetical protein